MLRTGPKRADECAVRTTTRRLLSGVGRVRPSCGQQLRRPCPAGRPRPARAPQVTPPIPPGAGAAAGSGPGGQCEDDWGAAAVAQVSSMMSLQLWRNTARLSVASAQTSQAATGEASAAYGPPG